MIQPKILFPENVKLISQEKVGRLIRGFVGDGLAGQNGKETESGRDNETPGWTWNAEAVLL